MRNGYVQRGSDGLSMCCKSNKVDTTSSFAGLPEGRTRRRIGVGRASSSCLEDGSEGSGALCDRD